LATKITELTSRRWLKISQNCFILVFEANFTQFVDF
jgi:hypothetical protein